jgi:hypothetical protein
VLWHSWLRLFHVVLWHSWLRLLYEPKGRCHRNFLFTYPSGCTLALGSIQPQTEMCVTNIYWGKDDRCKRLMILLPHVSIVLTSGSLSVLEPLGSVEVCIRTVLLYFAVSNNMLCHIWVKRNKCPPS